MKAQAKNEEKCREEAKRLNDKLDKKFQSYMNKKEKEYDRKCKNEIRKLEDKEEKETNKNMNFINGSAFDMPIGDNTYDFVYSTDMIEHINKSDRKKVFEEAIRVCKKGGYVLFMFPCGIWGKLSDIIIYIVLKSFGIFKKSNKMPGWLIEHLSNDYPKYKEINKYIEDYNVIENKLVHNIFIWTYLSLIGFSRLKKEKIVSKILNDNSYESESLLGVRKFILIKK